MSEVQELIIDNGKIDWSNFLDVFIITNERKSFEYAKKLILNQYGIKFNFIIIKNMKWLEACNTCLDYSNKPFYFRIDDDMLLNPYTFLFFNHLINNNKHDNVVMFHVKLSEPWNNRLANKVKVYNRNLTKKIGFEIDSRGKVDKIFDAKRKKYNLLYSGDKRSFVGIHAACDAKDNIKYTELFGWKDGNDLKIRQK